MSESQVRGADPMDAVREASRSFSASVKKNLQGAFVLGLLVIVTFELLNWVINATPNSWLPRVFALDQTDAGLGIMLGIAGVVATLSVAVVAGTPRPESAANSDLVGQIFSAKSLDLLTGTTTAFAGIGIGVAVLSLLANVPTGSISAGVAVATAAMGAGAVARKDAAKDLLERHRADAWLDSATRSLHHLTQEQDWVRARSRTAKFVNWTLWLLSPLIGLMAFGITAGFALETFSALDVADNALLEFLTAGFASTIVTLAFTMTISFIITTVGLSEQTERALSRFSGLAVLAYCGLIGYSVSESDPDHLTVALVGAAIPVSTALLAFFAGRRGHNPARIIWDTKYGRLRADLERAEKNRQETARKPLRPPASRSTGCTCGPRRAPARANPQPRRSRRLRAR